MMGSSLIAFIALFVGVTFSLPLKNNEVEDFVLRPNDVSRFSPYSGNGINEILERGKFKGRRLSVPANPFFYDYYLTGLDASNYGRNDEDPSIVLLPDRRAIIKKNFDEIDRTGFKHLKRNFDEIDRVGFNQLKRSV